MEYPIVQQITFLSKNEAKKLFDKLYYDEELYAHTEKLSWGYDLVWAATVIFFIAIPGAKEAIAIGGATGAVVKVVEAATKAFIGKQVAKTFKGNYRQEFLNAFTEAAEGVPSEWIRHGVKVVTYITNFGYGNHIATCFIPWDGNEMKGPKGMFGKFDTTNLSINTISHQNYCSETDYWS